MGVNLKEEYSDKMCRVYAHDNVYGPTIPHDKCFIICGLNESPPPLMNEVVFKGSYNDCVSYAKENCKNCLNCPAEE